MTGTSAGGAVLGYDVAESALDCLKPCETQRLLPAMASPTARTTIERPVAIVPNRNENPPCEPLLVAAPAEMLKSKSPK